MISKDARIVWKEKSDLFLLTHIQQFIGENNIQSVRQYQQKLKEFPRAAPSIWFITERFGSWDKLLIQLGQGKPERYCWSKMSDEELYKIVRDYVNQEEIYSQKRYERESANNPNVPSLFTLKKRFENLKPLFKKEKQGISDTALLIELHGEIVRLGLEDSLSMTEFRNRTTSEKLPSVDTIMRKTGKSWEELMEEIGFDYRKIKVEKLIRNFK
ncbi:MULTISPECIES: hypothetical protein [Enterococcus]|uniref:hypothetical protein n=1 Tax=Enterococcus TaxID=1350 RepID=UPI000CF2127C|nr:MULTISPECIES: hypothetical protein [Enterococcus]EHR4851644.1 hypothetical protein [Enterococcus faecalis]EMC0696485.1 hypothetical protein [Enterococcus faecalis]MDQ8609335.1 hypothetical protein [Enterococcus sp. FR088]MDT2164540.1 hypothetical protein [Enterococcus faecalis]NSV79917.1 hypothetical protein [Enterococcus faecalis]